jgi:hypothetical protein
MGEDYAAKRRKGGLPIVCRVGGMTFLMLMAQFCAEERAGRMEEQGETSTVEHLFTTDELTIEIRKARPKVSTL